MKRNRTRLSVVIPVCVTMLALAYALPQMDRPLWHDEVATLELFAGSGPFYPFTNYQLPNNHILSSAVLALMRPVCESPSCLRLWPLAATLSACMLLVVLARRLGGDSVAWLAGVAFACSGITQSFAVQLRGYAPSWPFLLLAALAVALYAQGKWGPRRAMVLFALASLAGVALLPTNLPLLLVLAAIAAWLGPPAKDGISPPRIWQRLLWLLLPLLGLLGYAGVATQMVSAASRSWNPTGRWETLGIIYGDMTQDALWLLLLMVAGAVLSWRSIGNRTPRNVSARVAGLALVLIAPLAMWLLSPAPPFARAIVPWWPLIVLVLALLAAESLRHVQASLRTPLLALALVVMVATAAVREITGWRPWLPHSADQAMPQTLLLHYYIADYHPDLAVEFIADWLREPSTLVWSDHSDFPSLRWHLARRNSDLLPRLHYAPAIEPTMLREWLASHRVLLVTASEEQACRILARADTACTGQLEKVADSGFFKSFRVHVSSDG